MPTEVDDIEELCKRAQDQPLCIVQSESLIKAMDTVKDVQDRGVDLPMVFVIRKGDSTGSIGLDDERPWIRGMVTPLDCFELASNIKQADEAFIRHQEGGAAASQDGLDASS